MEKAEEFSAASSHEREMLESEREVVVRETGGGVAGEEMWTGLKSASVRARRGEPLIWVMTTKPEEVLRRRTGEPEKVLEAGWRLSRGPDQRWSWVAPLRGLMEAMSSPFQMRSVTLVVRVEARVREVAEKIWPEARAILVPSEWTRMGVANWKPSAVEDWRKVWARPEGEKVREASSMGVRVSVRW